MAQIEGGTEMTEQNTDVCSGGPKLIFSCSGAADVGSTELSSPHPSRSKAKARAMLILDDIYLSSVMDS